MSSVIFRTEFALEGCWYSNALRFENASEAVTAATAKFNAWILPDAWRVVADDVEPKQVYLGDGDPTAFHVSDAAGTVLA